MELYSSIYRPIEIKKIEKKTEQKPVAIMTLQLH